MQIWQSCIAKYLPVWRYFIAKWVMAIWQHPIAKHMLAILATSHCLNRNDRVSSFYWTRGSKLCFLTCFSYFSRYLFSSIFAKSLLTNFFAPFLAAWESDFLSRFSYLWHSKMVRLHAPPYFWHRMHGFLEARCSWEPGSQLTTSDFSPFRLLPKVSGANVRWTECKSYFSCSPNPWTDTFLLDLSLAKLCSTARLWNPQGISKLVNKVDCWVPCALLKAIVWAFLATKFFAVGSSTYPCHMACVSKSVSKDVISLSDCCPQRHRSPMDVMRDCRGWSLRVPFLRFTGSCA